MILVKKNFFDNVCALKAGVTFGYEEFFTEDENQRTHVSPLYDSTGNYDAIPSTDLVQSWLSISSPRGRVGDVEERKGDQRGDQELKWKTANAMSEKLSVSSDGYAAQQYFRVPVLPQQKRTMATRRYRNPCVKLVYILGGIKHYECNTCPGFNCKEKKCVNTSNNEVYICGCEQRA